MLSKIKKPMIAQDFYRLPFKPGTKILTKDILHQHSNMGHFRMSGLAISVRKLSFSVDTLTVGIMINKGLQQRVYLKITPSELLVSCSVDTDECYLSFYAYVVLSNLTDLSGEYDFENYYWPGFFNEQTRKSKYLKTNRRKADIVVSPKLSYLGLFKPGNRLPLISVNKLVKDKILPVCKDVPSRHSNVVLGFCLADSHSSWQQCDHYPFLIPYTGTLNKNKTAVRDFKTFISDEKNVTGIELTDQQQRLIDICFAMKRMAPIADCEFMGGAEEAGETHKLNEQRFKSLFELWQQAVPLLTGRLYTYCYYTRGIKNAKGKPSKSSMIPCDFSDKVPEICFLWKDKGEYYKLVMRFRFGKKIHNEYYFYNTDFFVQMSVFVKDYILLNSLMDCELVNFFQKRHYEFIILKDHYQGNCKYFVDQLRSAYKFINS